MPLGPMNTPAQKQAGVHQVMHEFKHGALHSGSKTGPVVKNRKQAIAIALSQTGQSRDDGGKVSDDNSGGGLNLSLEGVTTPAAASTAPSDLGLVGDWAGLASNPVALGRMMAAEQAGQANSNSLAAPVLSPLFADGGKIPGFAFGGSPFGTHSGPIASTVPGRTDRHNVNVRSGSYVLPADVVSHIGQNNTAAGHKILGRMFSGMPYGGSPGPRGTSGMSLPRATMPKIGGARMPSMPKATFGALPKAPKLSMKAPRPMRMGRLSDEGGARGDDGGAPTPIVVAGGEYTVPRETVQQLGSGDLDRGHSILDAFVMRVRKDHIDTLKKLPPPAKK